MRKEYLALFDLDGTLFDTNEVNFCAYRDALSRHGVILDREFFVRECNGRHYTEFLPKLLQDPVAIEAVHKEKKTDYVHNLDKARCNRHLFNMIQLMKDRYHLAVVTTASRKNCMDILCYFGYEDLFEFLVTQEDITKVKPDPEGFLIAMKHFDVCAERTVIFEDSEVGAMAARATGATVFLVNQM